MSQALHQQCIAIAGALAEEGVRDLTLRTPSGAAALTPSQTDLPGLLLSAPIGATLRARRDEPPMTLIVERRADRLAAIHATGDAGARLAAALNA